MLKSSAVAFVMALSGQACAPTPDASDTTAASAAPTGDTIRIAREISEDLTGDGRPEHLGLDARGPGD